MNSEETTFIATAMRGYQGQLLIHVPKDTIRYLDLKPREKVLIKLSKTGMVSTRKLPDKPFQKKEKTTSIS
jgi:hypothetical protein